MIGLLIFLSLSVFAATESTDTFEKTYARDNTFCSYKNQRIELLIRGSHKFIESKDRGYGEFIFYQKPGKKPKLLKLNNSRSDTFRFFLGTSPHCSKSHGYQIDSSTMAILLLKENKPFIDKLIIQHFDMNTLAPKNIIETNYSVQKAFKIKDGFVFKSVPEMFNPDMGKVNISGEDYIYQERAFPLWINYTIAGFVTSLDTTFSKSPWKIIFKDMDDFITVTGWNAIEKKFTKSIAYEAVNYKIKKKCLLFIEAKQKVLGNEAWRCHAI